MAIADVFRPAWGWLLIEEDSAAEKIGEVWIPQKSQGQGASLYGRIVRCGPDVPPQFSPGKRVLYSRLSSRTELSLDGQKAVLLSCTDVFCTMDGEEGEGSMFEKRWADHAMAPPGRLLVERAQLPTMRGLVHLSGKDNVRSSEVDVVNVGAGVPVFREGDRAFSTGEMARHAEFGIPGGDTRTLWQCTPRELVAHIDEPSGITAEVSPAAGANRLPSLARDHDHWEEGDKGAPQ